MFNDGSTDGLTMHQFTELKASQTHSSTLPHIVMWLTFK